MRYMMQRGLLWILGVFLTFPLMGKSVVIRDVKVLPRWPWNGLVDIVYTVESTMKNADNSPALISLEFSGYDRDRDKTVAMKALTGDGAGAPVKAGAKYKTTWDITRDYPDFNSSAFKVTVKATAVASVEKRARNPWYDHHDLTSCFIAGVNNFHPHFIGGDTKEEYCYRNGTVASPPFTVYVGTYRRPPDPETGYPGDKPLVRAVLQYKILPDQPWVTVSDLDHPSWNMNFEHPISLFGKNKLIVRGWPAGTEMLIRVYLSDGTYETGDLNADIVSPVSDMTTLDNGWYYEGGWAAPFVMRVVLSGKERPW